MSDAIVLDATPLGLLSNPRRTGRILACRQWLADLRTAGRRVILPEIADYEIRRELLRGKKRKGLLLLDSLAKQIEYVEINTATMRIAAGLWAQARQQGQPTAHEHELDCDVILAAQALALGVPVVVATSNVGHLARFVPAEPWANITA